MMLTFCSAALGTAMLPCHWVGCFQGLPVFQVPWTQQRPSKTQPSPTRRGGWLQSPDTQLFPLPEGRGSARPGAQDGCRQLWTSREGDQLASNQINKKCHHEVYTDMFGSLKSKNKSSTKVRQGPGDMEVGEGRVHL
jgi:hypothetical protein